MRFLPAEDGWEFDCVDGDFFVRGGPDGPDPARFDMARFAAARIGEFVSEANEYLSAFVVPERFEASGPWELMGADFGRAASDPSDTIDILLSLDGDGYGMWWVRFRFAGPQLPNYYPNQFGRRQM
jgi:hypothetical protein